MTRNDGFQALAPAQEGVRELLMLSEEGHSKEPKAPRGGGGASSPGHEHLQAKVTRVCPGVRPWEFVFSL